MNTLTEEIEYDEDPRWAYPELSVERAYLAWPCGTCGTRRDEHASEPEPSAFPELDITDHVYMEVLTPVTFVTPPFTQEEKDADAQVNADGRWERPDGTPATDREAAYAIWGGKK